MKVGILSMQSVRNSGSFLQAYGLKKIVESYGHEVEFIDFNTEKEEVIIKSNKKLLIKIIRKTIAKFKFTIKYFISNEYRRKAQFQKKFNNYLKNYPLELSKYLSINSIKYNTDGLDVLIIGSDEVFNLDQYDKLNMRIPWELLGYGCKAKKLISYAASCGHAEYDFYFTDENKKKVKTLLNKFDGISVRDKGTYDLVYNATHKIPAINIDPVLLYDFEKEIYNESGIKDYIVVYGYNNRFSNDEKAQIKAFAKKENKKLICINYMQAFCDEYIVCSSFEMLEYFRKADYIITDTFHGCVISIKYNKKFVAYVRESNKNKLGYLLEKFGLSDRTLNHTDKINGKIIADINFENINAKIRLEQSLAYGYLDQHLS